MKNRVRKLLCLALSLIMLLAALPAALPAVSAATPAELRQVTANQAKAIAETPWKMPARRSWEKMDEDWKEEMLVQGARTTTLYEYTRVPMPYLGPITEINNVSLEAYKAQLVDGFLPDEGTSRYAGMHIHGYLSDVLSRLIPNPILNVKDALTAEGLTPLFTGADLTASSSKEAAAGISYEDAEVAYGQMELGDILLAWDDAADGRVLPRLHVMVISEFDRENRGTVTVTYPMCGNAIYHFVCSSCGMESAEATLGYVLSTHMVSTSSKFARWATHNETYPESGCTGQWEPIGGSTWTTETVSFEQLFGYGDAAVPYGGVCYLPYTLDAYKLGQEMTPVEVKATSAATGESIAAGFKATVESNYRIVQVDAVLSQLGKPDQVFTNYPAWDAWSYEYQNDALDKALFENTTGSYTLSLKVHSGPVEDPDSMAVPVTEAYKLELELVDPSFYMETSADMIHQGQPLTVTVKTMEDGITGAQVTMDCDREYFALDLAASKSANPKVDLVANEDGTVTVSYFGEAMDVNETVAQVVFKPVRTGKNILSAAKVGPFVITSAQVARTANATAADLGPARAGGEQPRVGVGLNIAVYKEYATGVEMIALLVDASEATATYAGQSMFDITRTNLRADGKGFSHVYAYVDYVADPNLVKAEYIGTSYDASTKDRQMEISMDIDGSGAVDIGDVQTICHIVSGTLPLEGNVNKFLLADVDRNGKVEMTDAKLVFEELK